MIQRQDENRQELESRIRHLEKLIGNLASQSGNNGAASTQKYENESTAPMASDTSSTTSSQHEVKSGRLIENDNQMIYVSPDHWAAIHDEVRTL